MASKIKIRLDGDGWVADHEGDVAIGVVDLFGTATIPTPFLKVTPGHLVVDALQRLNPGVTVELA